MGRPRGAAERADIAAMWGMQMVRRCGARQSGAGATGCLAIPDNRQRGLGHHGGLGATRPIAGRSAAPPERPDRRDGLRFADFISANVRS
ncbi:hypothetical protein GCM10010836_49810 [Aminobacter aminovorans]